MKSKGNVQAAPAGRSSHNRRAISGVAFRPSHGVRVVRQTLLIEQILSIVGGGQRLAVLQALAEGPRCVTALAEAIFTRISTVSRDLSVLEQCGFVQSKRVKNSRIYSLTQHVRGVRQGEMLQIVVTNGSGNWLIVHVDESADESKAIDPPDRFVEGGC